MRTIIWFIYFWLYLIALIPKMIKAKRLKSLNKTQEFADVVHNAVCNWAKRLMTLAGVKVTVLGKENLLPKDKTCLYVSNHQGNFDIPLMLTCLPFPLALVAKIELKKLPLISTWMELLNCVFIDRDNIRQGATAIKAAGELLQNSTASFVVFPEGTRSKSDTVAEFKGGAFKIATSSKSVIVPVAISGSYKAMEANGFWIKPANVTVQILPAIQTENMTREEIKALPSTVRQLIVDAKNEIL